MPHLQEGWRRFKLSSYKYAARIEEVKPELKVERKGRVVLETQVKVLAKREKLKAEFRELIS